MDSEEVFEGKPLKKIKFVDHNFEVSSVSLENGAEKDSDSLPKIEKPMKPLSPYLIFVKDYKEKHGSVSFKELGSIWKEMTIEEKHKYVKIAEEDLKRYKEENAKYLDYISQNPQNEAEEQKENNEDVGTVFPLGRIKNMLKCDEDNKLLKKNVLLYLEQATELFGEYLTKEMMSYLSENKSKRKKMESTDLCNHIKKNDIYRLILSDEVIKKNKKLAFLRSTGIIEANAEKSSKNKSKEKTEKSFEPVAQKIQLTNNKKIEDYFKKIK